MATATASGLQSEMDVNASPVIPMSGALSRPHTWAWIWFVVAIAVILGFHIRVFGRPIPPTARFPG
jgi:hypothetical protein